MIETAEIRLELAKKVQQDFSGKLKHGGLTLNVVAEYTIVDDGQNRWIVSTEDYEEAVEKVIELIIEGHYDFFDYNNGIGDIYTDLCNECTAIFCNLSGMDEDVVYTLDVTIDELVEICDLLCIDMKECNEKN